MVMKQYFVCYIINGRFYDSIVKVQAANGEALVKCLRQNVHPDRPGDPSDGMKPQRTIDCTIVNFIALD